jgi:hypothetical protein
MTKIVKDKKEIDGLFKMYFGTINGRYFIKALESFINLEGYGYECVCF